MEHILSDIGYIEITGEPVKARPPWIAQAIGPDLVVACYPNKRIAAGDRIRAASIDIDP